MQWTQLVLDSKKKKTILGTAARAHMQGKWRTPQIAELFDSILHVHHAWHAQLLRIFSFEKLLNASDPVQFMVTFGVSTYLSTDELT